MTRMKGPDVSPRHTGPRQDHSLSWEYLAGRFDTSGTVYENHNEARLRFAGYDHSFLEHVRRLVVGGSITSEKRGSRLYWRLTITGRIRIVRTLNQMLPYLQNKRELVDNWLRLELVKEKISSIQRSRSLKPGRRMKRELHHVREAVRQLTPLEGNGLAPGPPPTKFHLVRYESDRNPLGKRYDSQQ